jgi:hypothetical protein
MKRIIFTFIIAILITAVMLTGCDVIFTDSEGGATGSGNLETRQYDFRDFSRVDIGYAFRYEIEQSDNYSIRITADNNIFEHLQVKQSGEKLSIGLKPFLHFGSVTLEAVITMPRLTGLESSGATRGTITGFNSGDDLNLNISGDSKVNFVGITAGDIEGDISGASSLTGELDAGNIYLEISGASRVSLDGTARDIIFDISGASDVEGRLNGHNAEFTASGDSEFDLEGACNDVTIYASGASRIKLEDFSVNNAGINLGGASTCNIDVSGTLDVELSGASELIYTGEAVIGRLDVSNSSTIMHENLDE